MGRSPLLECFDSAEFSGIAEPELRPSADWCDGHTTGQAVGYAQAMAEQAALSAEIAQAIADMSFGFAEARAHILQGLKPLFGALVNRVLPGMAEAALATHVVGLLNDAATQDSNLPVELSVHPARMDVLTAILPYAVGFPVMLMADPGIGVDQAVLRSARAETALDVGAVIAGVQTALGAIFETTDERVNYG